MSPTLRFLRHLPTTLAAGDSTLTRALSTAVPSPSPPPQYRVTPPIKPWPQRLHPKRLIAMITSQQNLDLALQIFRHAGDYHPGFAHTYLTYLAIVRRLAHKRAFSAVESLLDELRLSGLQCGEDIFVAVIRCYGLAGKPQEALEAFARIDAFRVKRSVRSLNCLLNALVQNRRCDMVKWVFENCRERFGVVPNVFTGNILIKALCNERDLDGALKLFDEMPAMGMVPNVVTYTTVMGGYVANGDLAGAKRVFGEILDRGWVPDATTYTVLIDGYIKEGKFADAVRIMDEMDENGVHPNEITYNVVIRAYCKEKKSGEALNLLEDMLERKHIPSPALCCKVIDVLCQQGKVDEACYLWSKLLKNHCTPDNAISSTLIHWLCKDGKVKEARKLFDQFERSSIPSVLTYNTLIAGMCKEKELCEAARLWDDMVERKIRPNSLTYDLLIKGFCSIGQAREGVRVLEEMLSNGCSPNKSTYAVLIDCLRREGNGGEEVLSAAMANGGIDSDSWGVFFSKFVKDLDNGLTVLDKILTEKVC